MDPTRKIWDCRVRGKFKISGIRTTNPVAVGDEVSFEPEDGKETGVIVKIAERKNYIIRKSVNLSKRSHILAANIDHVYLMVTLVAPQTQTGFIDRFLVTAEAYHIPVTLLFNKMDLYEPEDMEVVDSFIEIYKIAGYRYIKISAHQQEDIAFLKEEIQDKKVMFGGHSGVGKTTLVNALDESLELKTSPVSMSHLSGQHTTTFAEMHPLSFGGFIIDTPGIKAFGLIDFNREELSHYFPEMRERIHGCKFNNCQHVNEPECAIKLAVEEGEIHPERYHNYLQMLEEDEEENYRKSLYR